MLDWNMGRDIVEEEIALPPSARQDCVWGDEGASQKIQKVLLSCSTAECPGYVSVNEQGLYKGKQGSSQMNLHAKGDSPEYHSSFAKESM